MISVIAIVYICLISLAIFEPTKPLKEISQQEMEDHEYDRIAIEES